MNTPNALLRAQLNCALERIRELGITPAQLFQYELVLDAKELADSFNEEASKDGDYTEESAANAHSMLQAMSDDQLVDADELTEKTIALALELDL